MRLNKNGLKMLKVLLAILTCLLFSSLAYGDDVHITGVTPVDGIYVDWLTSLEDAIASLPDTTITVTVGGPITVEVEWQLVELVEAARGEPRLVEQSWLPWTYGEHFFVGTFSLPDGVIQSDPPISLEVETTVFLMPRPNIDFTLSSLDPYRDELEEKYPWYLEHVEFDQPGEYISASIMYDGGVIERTYHYYVPSYYDGTEPMPLVFDHHGGGSYGISQAGMSRFDIVAENEGFIPIWFDRVSLGPTTDQFTSDIIDKMAEEYNIDTRRVYAAGISAGAGAAFSNLRSLPDKITAIAPIAAPPRIICLTPLPRPATLIVFFGTQDSSGWSVADDIGMDRTAQQHDCSPVPEVTEWESTPDDPTGITRYTFGGGVYGTELIVYKIHEAGHTWPGGYAYAPFHLIGYTTHHINGAQVMWDHFKNHQIPIEVDIDIKPGSFPNPINLKSKGVIPVAIMTTEDFDATEVDTSLVRLGPANTRPLRHVFEDVNGDGYLDMILHFRTQELGIQPGETMLTLTGKSFIDGAFWGSDSIRTVPAK